MQQACIGFASAGGPAAATARGLLLLYMRMGVCVPGWMLCCGCCWVVKEGDALVCVRCELHETNLCTYVRPVVYYADQARWMDRVPIIKQRQTSATRHCALARSANTQLLSMFSFLNIHFENWQSSEKEACSF
jgi:hypothetical protein